MSTIRELAAIMFTDIAGYTTIMGDDEKSTLDLLPKNSALHKSFIHKFNGKYIKDAGDSVVASFRSATDAVGCAVAIQKAYIEGKSGFCFSRSGIKKSITRSSSVEYYSGLFG